MRTVMPVPATAQLLMSVLEGRIQQYSRTGRSPVDNWPEQWAFLADGLLAPVPVSA